MTTSARAPRRAFATCRGRGIGALLVVGLAMSGLAARADEAPQIAAQRLVETTLTAHPELNALTFHVTPPGGADNIIIASNMAKIGKKADSDDLSVLTTGKPIQEPNKAGTRFGIELQMKDAKGAVIGVLAVGYVYKKGDDTAGFLAKAEALRDELAQKIPDTGSLMRPATDRS